MALIIKTTDARASGAALAELWTRCIGVVRNDRISPRTRLLAARAALTFAPRAHERDAARARMVDAMKSAVDLPAVVAELARGMVRIRELRGEMQPSLHDVAAFAATRGSDRALGELVLVMLRSDGKTAGAAATVPPEWIARAARIWIRDGALGKLAGLLEVAIARDFPDPACWIEAVICEHPRIAELLESRPRLLVEILIRCPMPHVWTALARACAGEELPVPLDHLAYCFDQASDALGEALRREENAHARITLARWLVDLRP